MTGLPRSCAAAAKRARPSASRIVSRKRTIVSVFGSSRQARPISAMPRSASLPTAATREKPTPRPLARLISPPIIEPDCDRSAVRPGSCSAILVDRVHGQPAAGVQVGGAHRVRAEEPRAGGARGRDEARLAGAAVGPGLGKAVGEDGDQRDPGGGAVGDSLLGEVGAEQDIGVLGGFGQGGDRGVGGQVLHRLAARVHGHDPASVAAVPEEPQHAPGRAGRVVREPDQRDRARREQRPAEVEACQSVAHTHPSGPASAIHRRRPRAARGGGGGGGGAWSRSPWRPQGVAGWVKPVAGRPATAAPEKSHRGCGSIGKDACGLV